MVSDRIGWYRHAKSGTHGLTGGDKTRHREGLYRKADKFHPTSSTHDWKTLGLGGHKVAMKVGSDATPEDLMKALEEGDEDVRWTAAIHPNATPEVLMKAVGDEIASVRWEAAKHPNATPEVLMKALGDGAEHVRMAAAIHPNATPEVLMKALENQDIIVRERAARHPNATPEVLMKALEDPLVGYAAASNRNATPEVLMKALEKKQNFNTRKAAASNRNATPEVLMKAVGDESDYIRWSAARHWNATVRIGAEWMINVLKSRAESEIPAYLKELRVHDVQFPLSDLIRLVIADRRVDLDGLDLFQKALEESKFAQYAPLFRRMIGQEKIRRKDGA